MDNDTRGAIDHLTQMSHALRTAVYHGEQAVEYLRPDATLRLLIQHAVGNVGARARDLDLYADALRRDSGA